MLTTSWLAAAERDQHREREQFARTQIDSSAGEVVPKAIRGQVALDLHLILWCRGVHRLDGLGADDPLLDREPFLHSVFGCGRWPAFLLLGNHALNTYRRLNAASLHTIETWEHLTTSTDIDT